MYENTETEVLRQSILADRFRLSAARANHNVIREAELAARKEVTVLTQDLNAKEKELRTREPELGGTYLHESGVFQYQSFYGPERWFYRIMGTTAEVHETSLPNYGACYEERVDGEVFGPFQIGLVRALWGAWRTWSVKHRGTDPGHDHEAVRKWREEHGLNG